MTIDLDKLNADLTAAVQGPLTAEGWRQITNLVGSLYPYRMYSQFRMLPAEQDAQLEQEVLAPLRAALDARWPATLRVVGINHHPRTRSLARILELSFRGDDVIDFGHAYGKKYTRQITKKLCAEMAPLWLDGMSCEGFILSSVSSAPLVLLNGLLDHSPTPLRHLRLPDLDIADYKKPDASPPIIEALADIVLDRCGQTLESLGISFRNSYSDPDLHNVFYNRLLQHPDKLPALRHLVIAQEHHQGHDVFATLMASPALNDLDTLSFTLSITHERARLLAERPASLNLRRIGAGWVNHVNHDKLDLRAFIRSPNLANVQVWDLRDGSRPDGEWESEEATLWAAELAGNGDAHVVDMLATDVVDLIKLDAAQTRAALFDGYALRPSATLKAIRIKEINDVSLDRLIDDAPTAWPALECLILMRELPERAQHNRIAASPLLQRLKFLDWKSWSDPERVHLNSLHNDKTALKAARLALIKRILDPATPPFIAYRLWKNLTDHVNKRPDLELFAQAIGLPTPYPDGHLLSMASDSHIISLLGGPSSLLLNGPQHLAVLDQPLVWPHKI